jgi:uncharacterized protein (DUF983 family)
MDGPPNPAEPARRGFSAEEVARFDVAIQDYGLAARRLLPSVFLLRCPACGQGAIFKNALYLKDLCPVCGVRFERQEGGLIVSMVLNYFLTILILLAAAIFAVRAWGFTDWLLPALLAGCVALILLLYRPSKALYLWFIWVLGFVHIDPPRRGARQVSPTPRDGQV